MESSQWRKTQPNTGISCRTDEEALLNHAAQFYKQVQFKQKTPQLLAAVPESKFGYLL